MTMKSVFGVDVHTEKDKQKAMKAVSSLSGIDSLAIDMKEKKLTVIGDVDPVEVVCKLKKNWHAKILTVGPDKKYVKKDKDDDDKDDDDDKLRKLFWSQYYPYYPQYNPYRAKYEEKPNYCWF